MMDEMEMDGQLEMDPYGEQMEGMDDGEGMEEEDDAEDGGVTFEALRDTIEKTEDAGKDQVVQAREANYISKGTHIW
jgi:hypothetical protein